LRPYKTGWVCRVGIKGKLPVKDMNRTRRTGRRPNSREAILDAAESVVADVGASHMTLDAVSAKAGVSKGGLLYHFPSKQALLRGMVERLIGNFAAAREREAAGLPEGPSRSLKAHVLSWSPRNRRREKLMAALIAAAAHDPHLLKPATEAYRKAFGEFIAGGLRPERAAVITMAVDGLSILQLLGMFPFDADQRKSIIEELLRLADEV